MTTFEAESRSNHWLHIFSYKALWSCSRHSQPPKAASRISRSSWRRLLAPARNREAVSLLACRAFSVSDNPPPSLYHVHLKRRLLFQLSPPSRPRLPLRQFLLPVVEAGSFKVHCRPPQASLVEHCFSKAFRI